MSESNKPKATTNLSIGYHNIEGKHSFLHGCKLNNHLNFINDIEILAETWAECDNCKNNIVINYSLLKAIEPQKTKGCKKGRKSGGILLYCKSYLKPFVKILKSSPTHIWFEINKSLFYNIPKNVRICSLYSPPESSNYYTDDFWDELQTDILDLTTNNTPFLLIGDINARTGETSDFAHSDNLNINYSPTRCVIESKRKNCDKLTNNKGLKLIDICKCYDMQIANGRFIGDCWGNFTHHNKNKGESTVDLAVISDNLFPLTRRF